MTCYIAHQKEGGVHTGVRGQEGTSAQQDSRFTLWDLFYSRGKVSLHIQEESYHKLGILGFVRR